MTACVAAKASIGIVIPAYNEQANLARLIQQILDEPWDDALMLDRIIIVDDYSDDDTLRIAEDMAGKHDVVSVLRHGQRSGKNAGIRDGITACRSDAVVILDADVRLGSRSLTTMLHALASDLSLSAAACLLLPLPARSWRERASRFQALFVAEIGRIGHGSLTKVYALKAAAIKGLVVPDSTYDDLYIPRWMRMRGYRYAVCPQATAYFRPARGVRDFAKQTIRYYRAARALEVALPGRVPSLNSRRIVTRALSRAVCQEPLGFILYVAWRSLIVVTPSTWWVPIVDHSKHDQAVSTKSLDV